jgi:mono/diheme cytochrome c family protein
VIGTIVFVLVFVVLGLSVVLVAMRSGRRPAPGRRPSRSVRRWQTGAIAAVTLLLGIGVPALVLIDNSESHAQNGPGGVDLSEREAEGRQLFARNCSTCHTLAGSNAVGRVGPNLDQLNGGDLKPAFVLDAIEKGRNQGRGNMPAGLVQGEDAKAVAEYVAAVAGRSANQRLRATQRPPPASALAGAPRPDVRRPSFRVRQDPFARRFSATCGVVPSDASLTISSVGLAITPPSSREFRRCYDAPRSEPLNLRRRSAGSGGPTTHWGESQPA